MPATKPQTTTAPPPLTAAEKREKERVNAQKLMEKAQHLLEEAEHSFLIQSQKHTREYPTFDRNEILFGPVLGVGGFGIVFEVKEFSLNIPMEVSVGSNSGHGIDDSEGADVNHAEDPADNNNTAMPHQALSQGNSNTTKNNMKPSSVDSSQTTDTSTYTQQQDAGVGPTLQNNHPHLTSNTHNHHHHNDDPHYEIETARQHMAEHARRGGDARYAVKRLHRDLSELELARGKIDLAIEAKFLSALWHPNIIKMRGFASGNELDPGFFIIMDRLYGTLNEKIATWKKAYSGVKGKLFGIGAKKDEIQKLVVERMKVAYDLAVAFHFMHSKKLVYRDIKQENIGFDIRGDVKVFDFGLAKGLSPELKSSDSYGYKLTARTGSVPYMAPEVADCKNYDTKADVFSLAILLWEILSLKPAFQGFSRREFLERVVRAKERPTIDRRWPPLTRSMMKEAWDHDPRKRPDMSRAASMLRGDLNELSNDSSVQNRTQHMRDRSSHSTRMQRMARGLSTSLRGIKTTATTAVEKSS